MWELHDDVLPCLAAVRPKARLAVISNFDGRLRTILRNLGVADFFEHLFISSEVGAEKPSPEIFRQALATMDVDPSACLHVGDDEVRDGNGARQAGLAVFLVDRPGRSLQDVAKLCV
jgi:putative hydrolase of the HAD superfamily